MKRWTYAEVTYRNTAESTLDVLNRFGDESWEAVDIYRDGSFVTITFKKEVSA